MKPLVRHSPVRLQLSPGTGVVLSAIVSGKL